MKRLAAALVLALLVVLALPLLRRAALVVRLAGAERPEVLPVPVDGVRRGDLRDTWHAPRSENRRHEGIDIFAPCGTPVRAATRGVVMRLGSNRLGGNVVWILGPGETHYYAHLERHGPIGRWDEVVAGDLVGYVGDTGNARGTPCHLHYGLYSLAGETRNPFPLFGSEPTGALR